MTRACLLICAVGLMAAGCGRRQSASEVPTEKATVGDVRVEITGRGELRALISKPVRAPQFPGSWQGLKATKLIKEGSRVKQGDLLFVVDQSEMQDRLRDVETEEREAKATYSNTEKLMVLEQQKLDGKVERLDDDLRGVIIDLELLLSLPTTVAALTAQNSYEMAKVSARHAEEAYKPAQELAAKGYVSGAELEQRELDLDRARAEELRAKLSYEKVLSGSEPIEVERARAAVIKALNALQAAEIDRSLKMRQQRMGVENARWAWLREQRHVTNIQESIQMCEVKAENDGVVVYELVWVGHGKREKIKEGQSIWPRSQIMRVEDTTRLVIRAEIEESQILKVRKGMKARVTVDAAQGTTFDATVNEIARIAHERGAGNREAAFWGGGRESSGIRVFDIDVLLDRITDDLKPGLNGSVIIVADTLENVLSVPLESVFREGDEDFVFVKASSGYDHRVASVAQRTRDRAVIASGLKQAEEVATTNPYELPLTDGADSRGIRIVRQMKVSRGPLPLTITEIGDVRPRDYVLINAPLSGEITYLEPEGNVVKQGHVILAIDDSKSRERLLLDSISLKAAEAQLEYARLEMEYTRRSYELQSEKLKADLCLAQTELQDLLDAPKLDKKQIAEANLAYCRVEKEGASRDHERTAALAEKGLESDLKLRQARLRKEEAEASFDKASVELELLLKGTLAEDLQVGREKVRMASIALNECLTNLPLQVDLMRTAMAVDQAEVDRANAVIERHQRLVDSAKVIAPRDGSVIYRVGWDRPEEGQQVYRGDSIIELTDLTRMNASTRVHEVDVKKVRLGQDALLRLEAVPERVFHGKVTSIAGLATDKSETGGGIFERQSSGVMIFDVTIEIAESDPDLRPSFTTSIDIVTDTLPNKLTMPLSFLRRIDGAAQAAAGGASGDGSPTAAVYVSDGGRPVLRPIKTGLHGSHRIVVEEGLREGETICLVRRGG